MSGFSPCDLWTVCAFLRCAYWWTFKVLELRGQKLELRLLDIAEKEVENFPRLYLWHPYRSVSSIWTSLGNAFMVICRRRMNSSLGFLYLLMEKRLLSLIKFAALLEDSQLELRRGEMIAFVLLIIIEVCLSWSDGTWVEILICDHMLLYSISNAFRLHVNWFSDGSFLQHFSFP